MERQIVAKAWRELEAQNGTFTRTAKVARIKIRLKESVQLRGVEDNNTTKSWKSDV